MLIIDAYNVLHLPMPQSLAGLDEARLCLAMSRSAYRERSATVVCDGRPKPHIPSTSPVPSVQLLYSGLSNSADDLIISLLDASTSPRKITVVTNDRAIKRAAKRRKAQLLSSESFITRLASTLGSIPPLPKSAKPDLSPVPEDQVRGWLEEFGLTVEDLQNDPLYAELQSLSHAINPEARPEPTGSQQASPASNEDIIQKLRATEKAETKAKRRQKKNKTNTKNHKNNRITPPLSKHVNRLDPDKLLSSDLREELSKYWPPPGL
ncbi:YacP-like NYN domain protein [Poriferisphaera corsica]|uniref:YacP-like NYN domain protein n=1 Tax=Poriferisphaera corsica TaxID=2528020 RepID=A0A517YRF7_9BACT|nr:NYN domain-containing protein [Poriferisphaera corsica]QDU32815.1 YacP-like NYN domain protein [Poriferisphaera corsica]